MVELFDLKEVFEQEEELLQGGVVAEFALHEGGGLHSVVLKPLQVDGDVDADCGSRSNGIVGAVVE